MPYITKQDIENAVSKKTLIQLCDDDRDGVADTAVVDSIIEDAGGEVDSWLQGQYTTPITAVDRLVKLSAKEFAVAFAFRRHPEYVSGSEDMEKRVNALFKRATDRMERIVKAIQRLPDASSTNPPANIVGPKLYSQVEDEEDPKLYFVAGMGDF